MCSSVKSSTLVFVSCSRSRIRRSAESRALEHDSTFCSCANPSLELHLEMIVKFRDLSSMFRSHFINQISQVIGTHSSDIVILFEDSAAAVSDGPCSMDVTTRSEICMEDSDLEDS